MAFSRLVFTVLILSVSYYAQAQFAAQEAPAFLWGDLENISVDSNPFRTLTTSEFVDNLRLNDHLTVFFVEETLFPEDFSKRSINGETAFPYLRANLQDSVYIPSVSSPLKVLSAIAEPSEVQQISLTKNGFSPKLNANTKVLVLNFEDVDAEDESRTEILRQHNDLMKKVYEELQNKYGKVLAVYTGFNVYDESNIEHHRMRRQATDSNATSQAIDVMVDGLRLYASRISIKDGDKVVYLNGQPTGSSQVGVDTMNTTLTFGDNSIVMYFRSTGGYWFLDYLTPDTAPLSDANSLAPTVELYALTDFSYRCGQNISFTHYNGTKSVTIENMKIQPFFNSTSEVMPFGDSFNCVGFFSASIWAGLFVVFILLAITFTGIMMMMDIRTMDRFDDPKGKTININASE